jgi:hypothetical protein
VADDEAMRRAATEARDDLDRRLLPTARAMLRRHNDRDRTATELTKGLIRQTAWGRIELASVLGEALVRLAAESTKEGER